MCNVQPLSVIIHPVWSTRATCMNRVSPHMHSKRLILNSCLFRLVLSWLNIPEYLSTAQRNIWIRTLHLLYILTVQPTSLTPLLYIQSFSVFCDVNMFVSWWSVAFSSKDALCFMCCGTWLAVWGTREIATRYSFVLLFPPHISFSYIFDSTLFWFFVIF